MAPDCHDEDDIEETGTSIATDDDDDAHGQESVPQGVPFPRQPNAGRPLRPKNHRKKKVQRGMNKWLLRNQGLLLIALAQVFISCMSFFFKVLNSLDTSSKVSANEIILIRMSITWVACVTYLCATGDKNPILGPPAVRHLLMLRGFFGFFGLFGLYFSLQYLSLADATVITFLSPLATSIAGYIFLKESFTFQEAIAGLVSLVGVALIARPKFLFGPAADSDLDQPIEPESWSGLAATSVSGNLALPNRSDILLANSGASVLAAGMAVAGEVLALVASASEGFAQLATNGTVPTHGGSKEPADVTEAERVLAVGVALLGVIGSAGAYATIRCIGTRASALHSVSYFSLWSTLVAGCFMLITGEKIVAPQELRWGVLLFFIGIFGFLAQFLAGMALQREKAGRAASAVYLQVVFATFFQVCLLHIPLEPLSALGASIILAAALYVTLLK
ncbi:hypothetical protein K437DRAFT_230165 [Tilletiaria anomala UBC 951]|uniref:EamA domain-containing protein n=1 Tax=Tilletiaria anomala (strain ATCC 24038 / CBS 436.72 / UBC 951) TaxID=1037660 RepID=A0A066V9Y6_TILAU|nr:uncharacterized protein K437DRAFT_230165 [Tilletiaria anomala UBC 951]KDN35579.1 hypothetical protein K437DRAFT_230165 [Tilletiaria anomala UBC 951]